MEKAAQIIKRMSTCNIPGMAGKGSMVVFVPELNDVYASDTARSVLQLAVRS